MIEAVVFDMDGVVVDSEPVWQKARVDLVDSYGRVWTDQDGDACRGRSSEEWSTRISERIGRELTPEEVFKEILRRMISAYEVQLPLFPGAIDAIERIATKYPVAVASGSPRDLIDRVLDRSGLSRVCSAVGYGDEVECGKPAPDVYLDVLDRMGVTPSNAIGVEDSESGLRSVAAAGMHAVAVVSADYQLPDDLVAKPSLQVQHLRDLTLQTLESAFA